RYQDGTTAKMIFDVATIISYLSNFMSLQPGDVISTGTPPGVGMGVKPEAVYLKAGQTMRLGIEGLGEQTQKVVQA
ncbi:MAG: fumarylacetoacetate hydrolase family protein, partial [Advenella sp.]